MIGPPSASFTGVLPAENTGDSDDHLNGHLDRSFARFFDGADWPVPLGSFVATRLHADYPGGRVGAINGLLIEPGRLDDNRAVRGSAVLLPLDFKLDRGAVSRLHGLGEIGPSLHRLAVNRENPVASLKSGLRRREILRGLADDRQQLRDAVHENQREQQGRKNDVGQRSCQHYQNALAERLSREGAAAIRLDQHCGRMFRQLFDRVVDFGMAADFIEQQRLVGLEFASENSLRDTGAGLTQTLGQRAQLIVEFGAGKNRAMLARGGDQVEPDFVKIQFDFVGRGLLADFIAKHSNVAAEWSRADRVLGLAAPESQNFWADSRPRIAAREPRLSSPSQNVPPHARPPARRRPVLRKESTISFSLLARSDAEVSARKMRPPKAASLNPIVSEKEREDQ